MLHSKLTRGVILISSLAVALLIVGCPLSLDIVPNVVGMSQSSAESAITAAGLEVGTVSTEYSSTVPIGQVISQNPGAGSSVVPGTTVSLVVSKGPAPVSVPNVVGMTQSAAQSAITNTGLTVGTVTQQYSATFPAGQVIEQYPLPETTLATGNKVNIVVSLGPTPVAPTADFNGTPRSGTASLQVQFTDLSTAGSALITSWSWDFGDGGSSTEQNPSHAYSAAGMYNVSLMVTTSVGTNTETKNGYITVNTPPQGPTAAFSASPAIGQAPLLVQFTDQSTAGSASITSWLWDFGDGATSSERNPAHTYETLGAFTVSLTVTTSVGQDNETRAYFITVYQGIEPIVEDTVLVSEDIPELVTTQVDEDSIKFTYNGTGPVPVSTGNILASGEGNGYLRQVVAITQDGATITAQTEPAALTDALEQADIAASGSFTANDFAKAGIRLEKSDSTFVRIDNVKVFGNIYLIVDYDGGVDFAPSVDLDIHIENNLVSYFKFVASGQLYLDLDVSLSASAAGGISYERSLFEILGVSKPVHVIYVQAGLVPVVVLVELDISVVGQVSGEAAASFTTGFDSTTTVELGAEYENSSWEDLSNISLESNLHTPVWTVSTEFEGRFYLKPKLSAKLYALTGPYIAAKPYAGFKVQPIPAPLQASFGVGIDGDLGFSLLDLSSFGIGFALGYNHSFDGPYYPLWSYTAPQPVLSVTPVQRNVAATAGSTSFAVSNTGTGTMSWTASVTSGSSWMQITSGSTGTNDGTINVSYGANASASSRTGTLQVTASGAAGNPSTVNVVQIGTTGEGEGEGEYGPPVITEEPMDLAVSSGGNATFHVVVETTPLPVVYQWYWNEFVIIDDGIHVFGSQTDKLELINVSIANEGYYRVEVCNVSACTISASAHLEVFEGEGEPSETEMVMLPGDVSLTMVWVPGGSFMMGRYSGEQDSYDWEDPQHLVTVPGFWMGMYELTKAQWTAVMGTSPWSGQSYVLDDPNSPAVWVSWNDVQSFLTALNTHTGLAFRLPSEAEWEYACRGGTTVRFYWGDDPSYTVGNDYCWWYYNADGIGESYAHVVGLKLPNLFGLYDMSGNVWEWCQDWYHSSYTGAPSNGSAWELPVGSGRVVRGGDWFNINGFCRSALRAYIGPSFTGNGLGFRLSR